MMVPTTAQKTLILQMLLTNEEDVDDSVHHYVEDDGSLECTHQ